MNGVGGGARSHDDSDEEDGRRGCQQARHYERPRRESVYLPVDLPDCRSCETGVERVPSEHDLGSGVGRGR